MIANSSAFAKILRIDVLKMSQKAHASHIASAFSIADILAVLYLNVLRYNSNNPNWDLRDRLVLSKGHAGAILYAALAEVGFFDKALLDTYEENGSLFSGHISHKGVPGVEFSTGSLGHGVCVATGLALAAKMDKKNYKVYVIVGDGETNEGSFWETIMFANQYNLSNLVLIIDRNHMQATGDVSNVLETGDLGLKVKEFGWNVLTINGHDHSQIKEALLKHFENGKPVCIVANTIKGKGVSFFENSLLWHYKDPQGEFYDNALKELTEVDTDEK